MAKKKQSIEDIIDDIRAKIDELEDRINDMEQCDHDDDDIEDEDEDEDE
jgi:prefoldin subunit 5